MSGIYLDHIGIATTENSPLGKLLAILGLPITGKETVDRELVDVEWVPLPNDKSAKIELLKGTSPESTISKYLAKNRRDGVHHLSFRVEEGLDALTEKIREAGFQMVYTQAKSGADHCRVNFIHPASTGGVLIELTEKDT